MKYQARHKGNDIYEIFDPSGCYVETFYSKRQVLAHYPSNRIEFV